jgi:hypothetical protein
LGKDGTQAGSLGAQRALPVVFLGIERAGICQELSVDR